MPQTSQTPGRTLGRTVWSLVLALLNATLILLALCLWLGWHVLSEARAISAAVSEGLARLAPATAELAGLRAEVAGLRGDLAMLSGPGDAAAAAVGRLAALDARLAAVATQLDATVADPGPLIDRAVDRAVFLFGLGMGVCGAVGGGR